MDLNDIGHWQQLEASLHGDHRPLIALLRSREPLSHMLREYIAEQLEKEAKQRFSASSKADLFVRREDSQIIWQVFWAKAALAISDVQSTDGDEAEELAAIGRLHNISDRDALDWLAEHHALVIDDNRLKHARQRQRRLRGSTISNPPTRRSS